MFRNIKHTILYTAVLAAVSFVLLPGCTSEGWSDCGALLELEFSYTLNPSGTDKFSEEVHSVDLFIFDGQDRFVKQMRVESTAFSSGQVVSVPVDEVGQYSIIALGNLTSGFQIGKTNGQTGNNTLVPGESMLDDFRFLYAPQGISAEKITDIFHGFLPGLDTELEYIKRYKMPLVKNTNRVNVTIQGLQKVVARSLYPQISVEASACHSTYTYNNSIDETGETIRYEPYSRAVEEKDLYVSLSVLRLTCGGVAPFSIYKDGVSIYTLELISEILKNPDYNTDSDLDKEDTFDIFITFETNGNVSISVNGWQTTESNGSIG